MKTLFLVVLLALTLSVFAQGEFDSVCGTTSSLFLGSGVFSLQGDGDVWVLPGGFNNLGSAVFEREFQGAFTFQDHVVIGSSGGTCLGKLQYDQTNGFTGVIAAGARFLQQTAPSSTSRSVRKISTVSSLESDNIVVSRDASEYTSNVNARALVNANNALYTLSVEGSNVVVSGNGYDVTIASDVSDSAQFQLVADDVFVYAIIVSESTVSVTTIPHVNGSSSKTIEYSLEAALEQIEAVVYNHQVYLVSASDNTIRHYRCENSRVNLVRSIDLDNTVSDWSASFNGDSITYFISSSNQGISSVFCETIACEEAVSTQLVSFTRESSGVKSHFVDNTNLFAFATGNNEIAVGSCLNEQCSSVSFTKSSPILANHDSAFDFVSTESGMMLLSGSGFSQEFHVDIHEHCNASVAGRLSVIDEEVYVCSVLDENVSSEVYIWVPVAPSTI